MDKESLFSVLNIIVILWITPLLVKIYKDINKPELESISTEDLVRDLKEMMVSEELIKRIQDTVKKEGEYVYDCGGRRLDTKELKDLDYRREVLYKEENELIFFWDLRGVKLAIHQNLGSDLEGYWIEFKRSILTELQKERRRYLVSKGKYDLGDKNKYYEELEVWFEKEQKRKDLEKDVIKKELDYLLKEEVITKMKGDLVRIGYYHHKINTKGLGRISNYTRLEQELSTRYWGEEGVSINTRELESGQWLEFKIK